MKIHSYYSVIDLGGTVCCYTGMMSRPLSLPSVTVQELFCQSQNRLLIISSCTAKFSFGVIPDCKL